MTCNICWQTIFKITINLIEIIISKVSTVGFKMKKVSMYNIWTITILQSCNAYIMDNVQRIYQWFTVPLFLNKLKFWISKTWSDKVMWNPATFYMYLTCLFIEIQNVPFFKPLLLYMPNVHKLKWNRKWFFLKIFLKSFDDKIAQSTLANHNSTNPTHPILPLRQKQSVDPFISFTS